MSGSTTASIRNKKRVAIEYDIEKARSEKDFNSLLSLLKKYAKITSTPNDVLEYLVNAERYIADNNYLDAQLMLDKALTIKPDDQEVIAYLGVVDYQRNDYKKALEDMARLANPYNNPNNDMILNFRKVSIIVQAFSIKGKCQESLGKSNMALASYQGVIDVALRYFKSFRAIDVVTRPLVVEAFIRMANINRYYGNTTESVKTLRNCLSSQVILPATQYKSALTQLAHALLRNTCNQSYVPLLDNTEQQQQSRVVPGHLYHPGDQVEEALLCLHNVEHVQFTQLQQNPATPITEHDMEIYDDLCQGYCRKGQYYQIVENYERSLSTKFGEVHRWSQLALSLYCAGKYKRSLFIIEECLALVPNKIELNLLGAKICINQLNQFSKGLSLAQQVTKMDMDSINPTQLATAYLLIGVAYEKKALECKSSHEKQANQDLARENLKRAHQLDPSDYRISYHLALIYAYIREVKLGLKYIQESLSINPDEPASWNLLALLLSSNKAYELAYRACKHALTLSPTNVELLLTKAKLEIALDDGAQALITYKSAMSHLSNHTLTSVEDWDETDSVPRNRTSGGPSSIVSFDIRSGATDQKSHRGSEVLSSEGQDDATSPGAKEMLRVRATSHTTADRETSRRVQLWLAIGEAFTQQRMFEDAAACLSQADSICRDNPDVYYQQGFMLEIQDLRQDALANYQKALTIDPSHTNSAIRTAVNHFVAGGDLLLAENNLTTILRSYDPTSHYAWFQLGIVLKAKGDIERASECFKLAIELDKTSPLIPYETISRHI
ncbi:hypothetical protein SAMD00019534_051690 [Acytostelium subglobosum LB1]|uniref:hypothetical protein n=1 Tax=Acytostelium subglobosum LB1 TaxID=1410327 RepID=UPI000644B743|nr:hypothetical protein SAMD00019534_051690 [Acytostelium subglobosum LB1]GAM21994.1 hypothetical protein SAMD00019534_051690 [Acytostelium subglobosum LB1]|eukprot:XP_012755094.1 hypothetical protein SAMD00019534_051690 [Acytostelium subglobosum LB1]